MLSRDAQDKRKNLGVLAVVENREKYYGQLEEIIEVQFPYDCSNLIFRWKFFDIEYNPENNFISINTSHKAY